MERLSRGLLRWTARHPGWKPGESWDPVVASVGVELDGELLLIDPLAPSDGTEEAAAFWRWVEGAGRIRVLLGNRFHMRSTPELVERVGAREGGDPPAGVEIIPIAALSGEERVFFLPAHHTLVFADAVLGAGSGALRVAPSSWSDDPVAYAERFIPSLRPLLELGVERVLPAHGPPVLSGGGRALAAALA